MAAAGGDAAAVAASSEVGQFAEVGTVVVEVGLAVVAAAAGRVVVVVDTLTAAAVPAAVMTPWVA